MSWESWIVLCRMQKILLSRRPVKVAHCGAVFFLAALLAWSGAACAASERVALLIGNNNYQVSPLRNAVNDARDLGEALRELGFKTIVRENTTRQEMIGAIREFGTLVEGAQVALFFYAGHAMQFKERNFLVPIDAMMGSEDDITFTSLEVGQVFDRMDRAKTRFNFVVLDACRDNPFAGNFRLSASGLAQMSAPSGTLIAYATSPGSVAADGFGRNGIYTKHILRQIKVPDLPVEIMFKRVRESVESETKRLQTPWDSSSLKGDFVFNASGKAAFVSSADGSASSDAQLAIEREFWISVRDSNRAQDIQAYLDKYPDGQFVALAKNRLEAVLRPTRTPLTTPDSRVASALPEPPAAPSPAAQEAAKETGASAAEPALVVNALSASSSTTRATKPAPSVEPQVESKELDGGVRELKFPDGSIYRGAVRGTALHGSGEYVSKEGFRYQGEFKEGKKDGKGNYIWPNGDSYEGEFANDTPHGKGTYKFANGDRYEGEVQSGVINGKGVYTTKAGDQLEGSFSAGKLDGKGVYKFAKGDRYEGDMVQGRINGKGVYFSANGDRLEGEFVDGVARAGTYRFSGGDRYEGEMQNGALSGRGAYYYSNGLKYEGEMLLGKPNGKGVFWFDDGSRFEGTFEDGLKKAHGHLITKEGSKTAAEIVEGTVRMTGS